MMPTKHAPVIIPTLNRYDHLRQCLESLEKCIDAEKTEVYVALDYPPSQKYQEGWMKNDKYLREKELHNRFKSLVVFRRETNYYFSGKNNGGTAIKDATRNSDRFIFSEDDNIFSPNFLVYMNACLEAFKDDNDVIAICGYSYPVDWDVDNNATCFRQQINHSAWGTGYWVNKSSRRNKDIWEGVILSMLPKVISKKIYHKMIDACLYDYINAACYKWNHGHKMMLQATDISIRAYLAVMNKFVISPTVSKVRNIGFDGSGVYCQTITDNFGNTAGTYDYSRQPIDAASTFKLTEDTKHADEENRRRLNAFDYRSPKQMSKTYRLLWLCEHWGIWSAKLYCLLGLPWDFFTRAWKKYIWT